MSLSPPVPLGEHQQFADFDSGVVSLDDWLKRRAHTNQASGASRTFVVCDDEKVVGFYALASGSITAIDATGKFRRNMPDPIPVVVLGRLAVDQNYQGRGIGSALMRDAAKRVIAAGSEIGIRGLVVHAINEDARNFYLALGFMASPTQEMTLMISLTDLKASL